MKKHISLYRKLIITLCVLSLFPYCGIVSGIICLIILKKLPGDIENVRGNLLGGARRLIVIVSCLGIAINIVAVIIFYVVMPPRIIRTEKNYGREIDRWAGDFSREYLRALAALECSGMNPPPSRFEAQFHKKLIAFRDGKLKRFGSLTRRSIERLSDQELRHLATSQGPFQIMGYHSVESQMKMQDIGGPNAVLCGIAWINTDTNYIRYIHNKQYEDAFHYHNAGTPFPADGIPTTYDSTYVSRGLQYINYFSRLRSLRLLVWPFIHLSIAT